MLYAGVLVFLLLQYLRPQEWVPVIYGWRVVLGTMLVLLPAWLTTLQNKKLLRTPEDFMMALYWCACVFSSLKISPSYILDVAWGFGKVVLCYLFVAHVIDTRRKLLVAVFAVCLLLLGIAAKAGWNVGLQGQYASVGMFANRNDFAHGIAAILPVAAAFLLGGGLFLKIVSAGLMIAVIPELIKSESRGGQLAAIFAVYTVLVIRAKKTRTRNLMLVIGAIGAMSAFVLSERLSTVASYQMDPSSMGRIHIWSVCLRSFRATPFNPVMGRGYGTIIGGMWRSRAAHSSYMNNLFELGLPGFAVFIGLLFFAVRDAYDIARHGTHPTTRMAAVALTGIMAGIIVGSGVESLSYRIYVLVPVAMVSAMRVIEQRDRAAALSLQTAAGTAPPADTFLHPVTTSGFGLAERGLLTRRDIKLVAMWTFACWLAYTVLVAVS